jgi:hypothetical protein
MKRIDENARIRLGGVCNDPLGGPRVRDLRPRHELEVAGQSIRYSGLAEASERGREPTLVRIVARDQDRPRPTAGWSGECR